MPALAPSPRRRGLVPLLAFLLLVTPASPASAQDVPAAGTTAGTVAGTARIVGVVWDSTARAPLADASVQLVPLAGGPMQAARSDAQGLFAFGGVPAGRYAVGFHHFALDSLLVELEPRVVDVRDGAVLRVELGIPGPATLVGGICGPRAAGDSSGVLVGQVLRAGSGEAVERGTVTAEWVQYVFGGGRMREERAVAEARSDDTGRFALCGVPTDAELLVQAVHAADTSGRVALAIPTAGVLRRDFHVAPVRSVASAAAAAAGSTLSVRVGGARLAGSVRGPRDAVPGGARVELWGSGREAVVDAEGRFQLDSLPAGTHTLEVRAVGFQPQRMAVDLADGTTTTVEATLVGSAALLDTTRVLVAGSVSGDGGFERRQRTGAGMFFDAEFLRQRRPPSTSDLLRDVPSTLVYRQGGVGTPWFNDGKGGWCLPALFIDGRRLSGGSADLDTHAPPGEVVAMEVYSRGGRPPAEFAADCGSIVVWTRDGAARRRGRD